MSTAGTKTLLIRSAMRWSGALSRWASSTSRCRRASTDSAATAPTRTTSTPLPLRVPPVTWSPGPRSTGKGLAGQHRLVHRRPARHHGAVEGEGLAGSHPHQGADRNALRRHQLPVVVVHAGHHPGRGRPQGQQRVHGLGRPGPGPGLDGPPGHQDGHDERGHHPVQPGGERAAAAEVEVAPAEGDGLDRADRQRGQGARGRSGCPCWWRRDGAAGRCRGGTATHRRSRRRWPGPARSIRRPPSPVRPATPPGRRWPGARRSAARSPQWSAVRVGRPVGGVRPARPCSRRRRPPGTAPRWLSAPGS